MPEKPQALPTRRKPADLPSRERLLIIKRGLDAYIAAHPDILERCAAEEAQKAKAA